MRVHTNSIRYYLAAMILFLSILLIHNALLADQGKPFITNVAGGQFTVSWITEKPCVAKLRLYTNSELTGEFYDERGKSFRDYTHYITVNALTENTGYAFSLESDGIIDNNKGHLYKVTTGKNLLPIGSIQPAGKVFLSDGITPAYGSVVYATISCPEGESAPLSTLVDENGYWFIELINARESDSQSLFNLSHESCNLIISAVGKTGSASLEGSVMDSEGGGKLYDALILK